MRLSRHKSTYGFFAAGRWKAKGKGEPSLAHEISLNPDYLDRPDVEWHSTLVHEMVHLWQEDHGHPSRAAYHNKEWGWKMEELGLIPSDTGEPGGKKTGQHMHHYINPAGAFMKTFEGLTEKTLEALRLKYLPAYPRPEPAKRRRRAEAGEEGETGTTGGMEAGGEETSGEYNSKTKYSCPCGNNVWGKPGLHIMCGECGGKFEEV
jgi:hypothetical protein